ncbi:Cwf15/Cwc15 cell cycle control protein [Clavulina sp. PMI_390]|nr:Cwf15/Cwc15 cell cycle control protein [Clavulina sp. PMI_390]
MSTAHRPTWDPAQARDVKGGSRQYSTRDMASQTKLKFRQAGQTSTAEVKRRDLRAELLQAEQEAKDRKRKAEGLPALEPEPSSLAVTAGDGDEDSNKRRKLLQEVIELDKDDSDDEDEDSGRAAQQKASGAGDENDDANDDAEDDDDDSDDSDEEDDTAELLRELEKIKRERAEEKARQEQAAEAQTAEEREAEIASGNPLLNLAAALGKAPTSANVGGSFAVKKRWDDDLVFKNQAQAEPDRPTHFVNDLLRTEFHKKFMSKFIK